MFPYWAWYTGLVLIRWHFLRSKFTWCLSKYDISSNCWQQAAIIWACGAQRTVAWRKYRWLASMATLQLRSTWPYYNWAIPHQATLNTMFSIFSSNSDSPSPLSGTSSIGTVDCDHSRQPSPPHSFIQGLKPAFAANPSHRSLHFILQDWLHGFSGLFTDTSEHFRSLLFR